MLDVHESLAKMLAAGQFEPYIRYIRFPLFRNIREGTKIDFDHPVTALVGPNGTNKTAILRALQGCPDYYNVGNYWFSTSLDPIAADDRHRFIHGYFAKSAGEVVEVVKTRIERPANPDYFEPSRPLIADGMRKMPPIKDDEKIPEDRSATRWKAIPKEVLYLDFRSELSAYDKFFFHAPPNVAGKTLTERKKRIRKRARQLMLALRQQLQRDHWISVQRIIKPAYEAPPEQVETVSKILGRSYSSIQIVGHRYFNAEGLTVVLDTPTLRYSEAFAGSGEFAVAVLVTRVMEAAPSSLILIDEPEVSLHPGAQRNLMKFLAEQSKLKRHQIVISTHAPEIVRGLPREAIKVLHSSEADGKVELVSRHSDPDEAFFRIGLNLPRIKTIFVEDVLAAAIIKRAIRPLGESKNAQVEVRRLAGGAGVIQTKFIPSFALTDRKYTLVYLDGDQKSEVAGIEPEDVPDSQLENTARYLSGGVVQIFPDGHDGVSSLVGKHAQLKQVLTWYHDNVAYLPGGTPEELVAEMASLDLDGRDAKEFWEERARSSLGRPLWENVTSAEILTEQERELANVEAECECLVMIRDRVASFLALETDTP